MPVSVTFRQDQPWSILPTKLKVDRGAARERAEAYSNSFRFFRAERTAEMCPSWVMGHEIGWRIHSPVDITFTDIPQVEVAVDSDPRAIVQAANAGELWQRDKSQLAVARTSWLHLYQFRTDRGWENMFLPNGEGTVEWRLGWSVEVPRGYFLLVIQSAAMSALGVPPGILTSTSLSRMAAESGMSVAVTPPAVPLPIRRGQEIARMILLHADSLQADEKYERLPGGQNEAS